MRIGILSAALCMTFAGVPQSAPAAPPTVVSEGPAAISGTQQYILTSGQAGRDFLVQVAAPVRPLAPGEKAAIVYVLDGDYMFGMATNVARNLQIVREIVPVYVVAIGYPGDSHADWVTGRLRDMLPEAIDVRGTKVGGGGEQFRRFLVDELRPFIEARHPVDSRRAYLSGHSLGGLFAADLLLARPDAFAGYAIGSPSIWVRPQLLDRLRQDKRRVTVKPRNFIGVGGEELEEDMVGWAQRLADTLRSRNLDVSHRVFAGEGHVSVEGSLFANGLKFLIPAAAR